MVSNSADIFAEGLRAARVQSLRSCDNTLAIALTAREQDGAPKHGGLAQSNLAHPHPHQGQEQLTTDAIVHVADKSLAFFDYRLGLDLLFQCGLLLADDSALLRDRGLASANCARIKEAIRLGPEFRVIRSGLENGKVDFAAVSEDPESGTSRITITGNLTATTSDLVVTTEAWQPAPGQGYIRTVMKQENSRVGDCSPGQDPWQ